MATISQTAANVAVGSSTTRVKVVQVGETVTQGMPLRLDTSDSKHYKSDANASAASAKCDGIALTPASTNGYVVIAFPGTGSHVNLGATLTVGTTYAVSPTSGAIEPLADITTGSYVTTLGTASTAALLNFVVDNTGIQKP